MDVWKKIILSHNFCQTINEGAVYSRIKIDMPKGKYEGYHFLFAPSLMDKMEHGNFAMSIPPGYSFELIKSNREKGKKYPRIKIDEKEIEEAFSWKKINNALAYFYEYDYKKNFEISREGKFQLGNFDDNEKWFCFKNNNSGEVIKKRISAKNFKIISFNLSDKEVLEIEKKINKIEENDILQRRIQARENDLLKVNEKMKEYLENRYEKYNDSLEGLKKEFKEVLNKSTTLIEVDESSKSVLIKNSLKVKEFLMNYENSRGKAILNKQGSEVDI